MPVPLPSDDPMLRIAERYSTDRPRALCGAHAGGPNLMTRDWLSDAVRPLPDECGHRAAEAGGREYESYGARPAG